MNQNLSNHEHWQEVFRQQKVANAKRWLALIENLDDPSKIIADNYDNFLQALESVLQSYETFELAYKLIQAVYFTALDYADWDRWLIYLDNALNHCQDLNRAAEKAMLQVQKGDIYRRLADLESAKIHYSLASEVFLKQKNIKDYASTLARLAILYDLQGDTKKGIELCYQSLALSEAESDGWVSAQAQLNLSYIYRRARNWNASLKAAESAYDFYKFQEDPKYKIKALMNIVAIWAELGLWEDIETVSPELIDTLTSSGDIRTLSQLKNNLGLAAFNQGKYLLAEESWQEALRHLSQIQELSELALVYNNLGMVYTKLKEWEEAEKMLNLAISSHNQLGDTYNWANSLDNLADLYEAQGKVGDCRLVLEKARIRLEPIAESPHESELLSMIVNRLDTLSPP